MENLKSLQNINGVDKVNLLIITMQAEKVEMRIHIQHGKISYEKNYFIQSELIVWGRRDI